MTSSGNLSARVRVRYLPPEGKLRTENMPEVHDDYGLATGMVTRSKQPGPLDYLRGTILW